MKQMGTTVCSCLVAYAFQSESTLYCCLNVKELLARNRREIWNLSDCSLAKWLSVRLRTTWLWVRVQLQSLNGDHSGRFQTPCNPLHLPPVLFKPETPAWRIFSVSYQNSLNFRHMNIDKLPSLVLISFVNGTISASFLQKTLYINLRWGTKLNSLNINVMIRGKFNKFWNYQSILS